MCGSASCGSLHSHGNTMDLATVERLEQFPEQTWGGCVRELATRRRQWLENYSEFGNDSQSFANSLRTHEI